METERYREKVNNRNMKLENLICWSIQIWLRIFGIWPESSCIMSRRLFWIIALMIEQILQYRYIMISFYNVDITEVINTLSETVPYSILLVKLGTFWCKQRTFNKILTMMAVDWEKCSSTEHSMFTMACKAKLSQRLANLTITLYSAAVILHSSDVLVYRLDVSRTSNVTARPFILKMNVPFDSNKRFVYESVVITQFVHLYLCSCTIGVINILLINLILHVAGQIDILCEWLVKIYPMKGKRHLDLAVIRKVVKMHQKIITFSKHIEELYSDIVIALFVSDTLVICCLGFVIAVSIGTPGASETIIKTLLFYIVINLEAFTYCFAGEYLSAKSKTIGDAVYDSLWYESDSKDCRVILLLIMRSQNQLAITIGKVMDLSLERFASVRSLTLRTDTSNALIVSITVQLRYCKGFSFLRVGSARDVLKRD
ncbi:odorant receptor 67c-like [Odontomachus brunneus]|uniref:odorant receptor 67c-like n=1 Tax=Odontomachus brunneus TaxID=486640 RepID=UPI0013F2B00D|nr:odorant receptor 67c-like [Odontomachus brunneus]